MKKETLKRIFYFLEEKENQKAPFMWKLVNNEPLTEKELDIKGGLFLEHSSMYIVNIKIPDILKGKVKIDFPEPFKIKESKETPLKLKK